MAIAWTARVAINTQQKNTIAVIKPAFRKASWAGIVSTSVVIPSGHFSPTLSSNRFGVCCGLGERPFGEDSRCDFLGWNAIQFSSPGYYLTQSARNI
jgi:hypothetical protein